MAWPVATGLLDCETWQQLETSCYVLAMDTFFFWDTIQVSRWCLLLLFDLTPSLISARSMFSLAPL